VKNIAKGYIERRKDERKIEERKIANTLSFFLCVCALNEQGNLGI